MVRRIERSRWLQTGCIAAAVLLGGCGTEPDGEHLAVTTYHTDFDPPQPAGATTNCDRMILRALLILTEHGNFELSINVIDDCTRSGEGFDSFEVYRFGDYTRQGNSLVFVPDPNTPGFPATLDGEFIVLRLPPSLGLSSFDLELRIGPRVTGLL